MVLSYIINPVMQAHAGLMCVRLLLVGVEINVWTIQPGVHEVQATETLFLVQQSVILECGYQRD